MAKYGPGVYRAAKAIIDGMDKATEDLPEQYRNRIEIGANVWLLPAFGIREYFSMIVDPMDMIKRFIDNPSRMLFGLSFGPFSGMALNLYSRQGYFSTSPLMKDFADFGWTKEEIDKFKTKDDSKFADSITYGEGEDAIIAFLTSAIPFAQLADSLTQTEIASILRGNTIINSKKVKSLFNYFIGLNYKKIEDIEIVFDNFFKLSPGEQYILRESLKRENPDLYDYLRQYSLLSKILKTMNASGKDWKTKAENLVNSAVVYIYYDMEMNKHGSGDEWLEANPHFQKIMEEFWDSTGNSSGKIYGKKKFEQGQLKSIANKILSYVRNIDDTKLAKLKLAGIDNPFTKAIKKADLRAEFFDNQGNFRLKSLDQIVNIVDAYGLEGTIIDINNVKVQAEKGYQDWKNLSEQAKLEKKKEDTDFYGRMAIVFKVLPDNIENLSDEESASYWNKYNNLLDTLIKSDKKYNNRYLAELPEWQRKYYELNTQYFSLWSKLRADFDKSDNQFFENFSNMPSWFQKWYFLKNPEARIYFPKLAEILKQMRNDPELNYYDLFYQKLGDKDWDAFREIYFKRKPLRKKYYPTAAIYNKALAKLRETENSDEKSVELQRIYDWLWNKQDILKSWDKDKPGQYIYIEKMRELMKEDYTDFYSRFYANNDKSWKEFRKVYFKRHPLREIYYPLALKLEGKTWKEREEILADKANQKAVDAWNEDKPGRLEKSQAYLKYEKLWNEFNLIDNLTWEGKRSRADYLREHPEMVKIWDSYDTKEQLAIKHKQKQYFDILYQIPADGKGRDYLIKYFTLKVQADKFLEDNPDLQTYWDKNKKTYTGKEKIIRDLLNEFNKLTFQADKIQFLVENPELDEYFLNQVPPGIRRLRILEKLYFKIDDKNIRSAFVKSRPELAEYWEISKIPAEFLINPETMAVAQAKLKDYARFTDAARKGDWDGVELLRKSVSSKPDTSTDTGKWLADKIYSDSMQAWASTFGSVLSTYFFRALPQWVRDQYFKNHPDSKILSYLSLGRALEEGLRLYDQSNKTESWANRVMLKYGKDIPYDLKKKVSREMIRLGKWEDRSKWTSERWSNYWLQRTASVNKLRLEDFNKIKLLGIEAKRIAKTYPMSIFAKPLKEFGGINPFLGSELLLMRGNLAKKYKVKVFDDMF